MKEINGWTVKTAEESGEYGGIAYCQGILPENDAIWSKNIGGKEVRIELSIAECYEMRWDIIVDGKCIKSFLDIHKSDEEIAEEIDKGNIL